MKECRICMTVEHTYIVFHTFNPKGIALTAFRSRFTKSKSAFSMLGYYGRKQRARLSSEN